MTCICALASPARADVAGRRPNIVLVVSDDQGYGDLGRHGNPLIRTPNLDRLYDEGVRFDDFHVSPTCAPTRASLMTGRLKPIAAVAKPGNYRLALGIIDPWTKRPSIQFANDLERQDGWTVLSAIEIVAP